MIYTLRAFGVAVLMISLLAASTDGFTGFTYESLRRSAVESEAVQLSDWRLESASGEYISLTGFDEEVLLIDFVYTRCPTVCRALGSRYRQLQRIIDREGLHSTRLLSISIDPEFDTPKRLALYRKSHGGAAGSWTVARPADKTTLERLLTETGLRVIPDPVWGLAHSDAIHVVVNGSLRHIEAFDSEALESLMRFTDDS